MSVKGFLVALTLAAVAAGSLSQLHSAPTRQVMPPLPPMDPEFADFVAKYRLR